jgi:hypothetical protein
MEVSKIMEVFQAFSYDGLYYSKYIFTLAWSLLFLLVSYFTLKVLSKNHFLVKILLYSYGLIFVVAALSMLYGYFIREQLQDDEYTLSRWLMGIAQSPIISLILLASEKLYQKSFQP